MEVHRTKFVHPTSIKIQTSNLGLSEHVYCLLNQSMQGLPQTTNCTQLLPKLRAQFGPEVEFTLSQRAEELAQVR
jgi:hypothetical protein